MKTALKHTTLISKANKHIDRGKTPDVDHILCWWTILLPFRSLSCWPCFQVLSLDNIVIQSDWKQTRSHKHLHTHTETSLNTVSVSIRHIIKCIDSPKQLFVPWEKKWVQREYRLEVYFTTHTLSLSLCWVEIKDWKTGNCLKVSPHIFTVNCLFMVKSEVLALRYSIHRHSKQIGNLKVHTVGH